MRHYIVPFWISLGIFISTFYLTSSFYPVEEKKLTSLKQDSIEETQVVLESPPCVKLYQAIEKYSAEYEVPENIAFGVAFSETRYKGPFDWSYNHGKTSGAGALGPMQVMYSTAKGLFPNEIFSREKLMTDIDFNVHCSMKLLRKLHDRYSDWKTCLGAYNTGTPCVNGYAVKVYNYRMKYEQ